MAGEVSQGGRARIPQEVRFRTLQGRRRRLMVSVVLYAGVTAAMVFVALLHRDAEARRTAEDRATRLAQNLQQFFDKGGILTREKVEDARTAAQARGAAGDSSLLDLFEFNFRYPATLAEQPVAGLCARREALRFYLRDPGRHVLVYDGERVRPEWFPESTFQARAVALGFGHMLDRAAR